MAIDVTGDTFAEQVLGSDKPVLVDFWAQWCGPCRQVSPILDRIATENGDRLRVVKVNVDENPDLAKQFDIRAIPAMKLFKGGEVVHELLGAMPAQALLGELEPHL
ncbi:thioredoxin [Kitasatospora sp. NPDC051853]|uniref:thioredoxin n=1 Tax=Kitasatospora sp. NPDC051853 TaxID=3364058 RepID=UPI003795EA46